MEGMNGTVNTPKTARTPDDDHTSALTLQPVVAYLDLMSRGRPAPAAGSAAAINLGLGAALAGKTARLSGQHRADAEALAQAADAIRDRAVALAEADAEGVSATISGEQSAPIDINAVPRQIAELAGELAELAERLAARCNPRLRADAVSAWCMADAASGVIDAILHSNDGSLDDPGS